MVKSILNFLELFKTKRKQKIRYISQLKQNFPSISQTAVWITFIYIWMLSNPSVLASIQLDFRVLISSNFVLLWAFSLSSCTEYLNWHCNVAMASQNEQRESKKKLIESSINMAKWPWSPDSSIRQIRIRSFSMSKVF